MEENYHLAATIGKENFWYKGQETTDIIPKSNYDTVFHGDNVDVYYWMKKNRASKSGKNSIKMLKSVYIFFSPSSNRYETGYSFSFDEFFGFQFSESKIIKRNEFRFKLCNLSKKFLQRKSIDSPFENEN